MITQDFYSGEPVMSGSPPNFGNPNNIISPIDNVNEAANMASFGSYAYNASARASQMINPGGYGYMSNPVYQQQIPNGINYQPSYGIGAPPIYQGYNPNQPTYNMYRQPGVMYPNQQQQQFQQVPTSYHIPGINMSGEYMPPADYEKRLSDLELKYYNQTITQQAKNEVDMMARSSVYGYNYGYGNNYYGMPYFNNYYQQSSADIELRRELEAIQNEARENRMAFNLNMSRLAHNFARDGISDDSIQERYTGRDIEVNNQSGFVQTQQDYWEINRFYNLQPFDNSQMYRDHFMKVKAEFNAVIPEDSNLQDTFKNMGIVAAQYEMEEEMHRRKDGGNLYNNTDNTYKRLIRRKAKERYAAEKGISLTKADEVLPNFNAQTAKQNFINNSSLKNCATLSDDGTLNVSLTLPCNVGSHAGQSYTVNAQESQYDEKRERFSRFMDSIPGSIYIDQIKRDKVEKYNYE